MDHLPNSIQENTRCDEDRNKLIEQLMLFCSNSSLTTETKKSCVTKRIKQHDSICALNSIVRQIYDLKERLPERTIDEICRIAYKKDPNIFKEYLKSTNSIIQHTPNVITLSQNYFKDDFGYTNHFTRVTFNNYADDDNMKMLWYKYHHNDTPNNWQDANSIDLGDGYDFNDIFVSIDDDLNLHLHDKTETEHDNTFRTIPYLKASDTEINELIEHLKGMNIEVRDLRDPRKNDIRLALSEMYVQ
jgi:hypothetical protein